MSSRTIHNIIFDLGGVLFRIDYDAPVRSFRALGADDFDRVFSQATQGPELDLYETGRMTDAQFLAYLSGMIPGASEDALREAWNSILLGIIEERVERVIGLREAGYRTFLLSNTNSLHLEEFSRMIAASIGLDRFHSAFERLYYSHELGMRKPHPETFAEVCRQSGILPGETLFIDDSRQHVEGARSAGLHAVWMEPGMDLDDSLRKASAGLV
jgi:glucose-1-phosphatase